jgi:hypothetical protein
MSRNARAGAIAFVAAAATLAAQVSVHRLVSAKMLNNFAFFVLSLTMLGFAASGAWLARRRAGGEPLGDRVAGGAALFAAGLVLATAVLYPSPPIEDWGGGGRAGVLGGFLFCVPLGLLYAAAFAGSGLVLGTLLSSPKLATRRLYALDLAGSAVGALLVVPGITSLGAERAAVACGAVLVLAAVVLAPPASRAVRAATAVTVAGLVVAAAAPQAVFRMRYARDSFLGQTQRGDPEWRLELVRWDPVSRIEVSHVPPPRTEGSPWPSLFGPDAGMLARFRRVITQNNNAFTYAPDYDGRPESIRGLGQTVYAVAYRAAEAPAPRVLVIGVGGGIDVLTALGAGASSVTGVEVNGATLDLLRGAYREHFRGFVDDPRVRLVHAEGRHYLASHPDRFDVLQLSGVDSVSGTPGAAHVFSESYLYTAEAFDLYLSRLSDRGVLNVMRPDAVPARDTLRLLATTLEALGRRGLERPADHVLVVADRTGQFVAVLAQLRPFTAAQADRVARWAGGTRFLSLVAGPGAPAGPPANAYAALLAAPSAFALRAALARYPWDVVPVSDDRPFFFRTSRWSHLLPSGGPGDPGPPVMELGLLSLLAVCGLAAVLFVYLPLRGLAGDGGPGAGRLAVFFGALGLGYMAIEMAFIQKFGLLLGHPNHALTVVLASLLFATGVGSLGSAALLRLLRGRLRFAAYALVAVVLAEAVTALPRLRAWVGLPFAARVAIVAALVFPVGVLLGVFFPTGLDRLKSAAPAWAPWAWGLNGMASVVAPVLSVAVSMTFGVTFLLLAAVPVYLVAGFAEPPDL